MSQTFGAAAENHDFSGGSGSSIAITLNGVTAGAFVGVFYTFGSTSLTPTVSDGTSYTLDRYVRDNTNGQSTGSHYLASSAGGNLTITISFGGSTTFFGGIACYATSDVGGPTLFDATGQNQNAPGTGTDAITSGTVASSPANCLALGYTMDTSNGAPGATPTAGTGFTNRNTTTNNQTLESGVIAAGGSVAATFTYGTNDSRNTHVMILQEPAAAAADFRPFTQGLFRRTIRPRPFAPGNPR